MRGSVCISQLTCVVKSGICMGRRARATVAHVHIWDACLAQSEQISMLQACVYCGVRGVYLPVPQARACARVCLPVRQTCVLTASCEGCTYLTGSACGWPAATALARALVTGESSNAVLCLM